MLSEEELEKFNIEMKALLIKYGVNLTIGQQIVVSKNEPLGEVTGTKPINNLSGVASSK